MVAQDCFGTHGHPTTVRSCTDSGELRRSQSSGAGAGVFQTHISAPPFAQVCVCGHAADPQRPFIRTDAASAGHDAGFPQRGAAASDVDPSRQRLEESFRAPRAARGGWQNCLDTCSGVFLLVGVGCLRRSFVCFVGVLCHNNASCVNDTSSSLLRVIHFATLADVHKKCAPTPSDRLDSPHRGGLLGARRRGRAAAEGPPPSPKSCRTRSPRAGWGGA